MLLFLNEFAHALSRTCIFQNIFMRHVDGVTLTKHTSTAAEIFAATSIVKKSLKKKINSKTEMRIMICICKLHENWESHIT